MPRIEKQRFATRFHQQVDYRIASRQDRAEVILVHRGRDHGRVRPLA